MLQVRGTKRCLRRTLHLAPCPQLCADAANADADTQYKVLDKERSVGIQK
jgi:hypothetical protein